MPWPAIAAEVRNLKKGRPRARTVRRYYRVFSRRSGRVRTKYANCGPKSYKMTRQVEAFMVKKLRQLRTKMVCTARVL